MTFTAQKAHWQIATYTLTAISVVLFIILLAAWTTKDRQLRDQFVPKCSTRGSNTETSKHEPGVLSELSQAEINAVLNYLFTLKTIGLAPPDKVTLNSSFIFFIELKPPSKVEVLAYIDDNGTRPVREASVMIFRGDLDTPFVTEYIIGELPTPTYYRRLQSSSKRNPVSYEFRPFTIVEIQDIEKFVLEEIVNRTHSVLMESYGASLVNCGSHCLTYSITPVSSAYLEPGKRKFWLTFMYKAEIPPLHPVDFQVLVDTTSQFFQDWRIEHIWYANQIFVSVESFVQQYQDGVINRSKRKFPSGENLEYGSMKLDSDPYPEDGLRGPKQYYPDGLRYSITGQNINYMKWSFNYSMTPSRGLRLYDVRFKGERIVYELSMQEIAVLYSGHSPAAMYSYYADGAGLFGTLPKGLVAGYDCPDHASFLDTYMYSSRTHSSRRLPNAICVFEHDNGLPLRRHKSADHSRLFYGSLNDHVLTVRIIIAVVHYDYIYDFIFHLNGVLEVRVSLSGYLTTNFYYPQEDFYGTQIHEDVFAGLHNHLFHFKADIDIKGVSNRFETLDIGVENTSIPWAFGAESTHVQKILTKNLRETEKNASVKFNFTQPKYLLFYNKDKSYLDKPKAYRLLVQGMSNSMLPMNYGFESSVSWARYQTAVTKQHEDEDSSSSVFAMWDARDPVVNFQSFIDNDESIVDEDLVAWVTLGIHHIPHSEDVPNTATTGNQLNFFLIPHNYFKHDPSMAVRNSIAIVPKDSQNPEEGITVNHHGINPRIYCVPQQYNLIGSAGLNNSTVFT